MSYAAVSTITVRTPDGGPLFLVDVPVEEILDTVQTRAILAVPGLTAMLLAQADQYAQSSVWPALRAEVDRATAEAEAKAKSATAKLAIGSGIVLAALCGGYLLLRRKP